MSCAAGPKQRRWPLLLFQPPQDKKGEFFIESPQKIFAFLMAYGPTPEELVEWMSNPEEIDRRLKGTEHAHLIDSRAHQQRAGVLGSLGLVADSLRLLAKVERRQWIMDGYRVGREAAGLDLPYVASSRARSAPSLAEPMD